MKLVLSRVLLVPMAVILLGASLPAQSAIAPNKDLNLIGTWKLNIEKSTYRSGPAPKTSLIHTWWWDGDSLKHKVERLNEKGEVADKLLL